LIFNQLISSFPVNFVTFGPRLSAPRPVGGTSGNSALGAGLPDGKYALGIGKFPEPMPGKLLAGEAGLVAVKGLFGRANALPEGPTAEPTGGKAVIMLLESEPRSSDRTDQ
jgi:hypothetical protein